MQPTERIFLAVLLAHLLADFPLQSSRVVLGKRRGFAAYLQHGLIHGIVLLGCLALFARPWMQFSLGAVGALLLYLGVHLAIDFLKQRLLSHHLVADSVASFLLDQSLHMVSMVVLLWWLLPPGLIALGVGEIEAGWLPVRVVGFAAGLAGAVLLVWASVRLGRLMMCIPGMLDATDCRYHIS